MTIATLLKPLVDAKPREEMEIVKKSETKVSVVQPRRRKEDWLDKLNRKPKSMKHSIGFLIFSSMLTTLLVLIMTCAIIYVVQEYGTPTWMGGTTSGVGGGNATADGTENADGSAVTGDGVTASDTKLEVVLKQSSKTDTSSQWITWEVPVVPILKIDHESQIVHDLTNNLTAYMDLDNRVCYIMPMSKILSKLPVDLMRFCRCRKDSVSGKRNSGDTGNSYLEAICTPDLGGIDSDVYFTREVRPDTALPAITVIHEACDSYTQYFLISGGEKQDRSRREIQTATRFLDLANGRIVNVIQKQ